jgi:ribosomal protein S18 acetylase RimI-like enzyme
VNADVMPMNTRDEIIVREAMASDAAELARLRWDSRVEDHLTHSRTEFFRECEVWICEALTSRRWIMAVAECGSDSLSGCMFLQCIEKVPAPGSSQRAWGYVTNAFVDSQRRGQGVGQKLLELLIEAARNRGLEFLIVWPSEASVAFYRRAGFRPVSEVHVGADDEPPFELVLASTVATESPVTA